MNCYLANFTIPLTRKFIFCKLLHKKLKSCHRKTAYRMTAQQETAIMQFALYEATTMSQHFETFPQIFLLPQMKRSGIVSNKCGIYQLPQEMPNDPSFKKYQETLKTLWNYSLVPSQETSKLHGITYQCPACPVFLPK